MAARDLKKKEEKKSHCLPFFTTVPLELIRIQLPRHRLVYTVLSLISFLLMDRFSLRFELLCCCRRKHEKNDLFL